jgi:hypothetical protein
MDRYDQLLFDVQALCDHLGVEQRAAMIRLIRASDASPEQFAARERAVRLLGPDAAAQANDSFELAVAFPPALDPPEDQSTGERDLIRIAQLRERTLQAQQALRSLEDANADLDPAVPVGAATDQDSGQVLSSAQRRLAVFLAGQMEHELAVVRAKALELGLVPLDAIRAINDWAEWRAGVAAQDLDSPFVEISDVHGTVWVDPILEDLLK